MQKRQLYLVDLFSFIFRAYYGVRPLNSPDGTPVNAVYGVVTMLNRLIETKRPDHLIICQDSAERNLRLDVYPQYKANREKPPEDLIPQIKLIQEFIDIFPIKIFGSPGYEADDIMATLVREYRNDPDLEIVIVSSDKDLMQLIDGNVSIYDPMKEKISKRPEVVEKFGVQPEQVVDVQSLCGDSSDNVPGVPGIGPKTAAKLIAEFGSLDEIIKRVAEIPGKTGERIREHAELAKISRQLVQLRSDVPINAKWDDLTLPTQNKEALTAFYQKLGFRSLIKGLANNTGFFATTPTQQDSAPAQSESEHPVATAGKFSLIESVDQLEKIFADFSKRAEKIIAIDTETDSLETHKAKLVGVSFCFDASEAFYLPVAHVGDGNVPWPESRSILQSALNRADVKIVGQNTKFDFKILANHGLVFDHLTDDTMLAAYLIDPDGQSGLDFLAERYLHYKMLGFSEVVPKGKTFADIDVPTACRYSAEDAWATFMLRSILIEKLNKAELGKIYSELEVPLVKILAAMETHGVLIDRDLLGQLGSEFRDRLGELEAEIYELAGGPFNINSPKQLGEILFVKLGLPAQRKTKTGYSTDVDVLTVLAYFHELPKKLLEYRMLSKLVGTYVEQFTTLVVPETSRVHGLFNQAVAATGRLSSSDPNLQNIPIKTREGRRLRELFVAPPGHVLFSADYSQIELRLLAAFSKDPGLVEAYKTGEDIHRKTAASIFSCMPGLVTDAQRSAAKTVNFGVIYGQSPFGLSQQLGVPQGEAKRFIEAFYREFSGVRHYREELLAEATRKGFVTTYLGRRRYLPDLNSRNGNARQNAERAAFNTVFQGSAADLIKKAMLDVTAELQKNGLKSALILQVHDELVFEVPQDELAQVTEIIPRAMREAFTLDVPLEVSARAGKNWAEAH